MGNSSTVEGKSQRNLGLADCILLSTGGMVGSAIFIFPGSTGQLTGPSSILAWLSAGILMGAIALCYTELTLAFPRTGAPAVFPYEAFSRNPRIRSFASYLEGVGYSFGWVFGITVSALAIGDYLAILIPGAGGYTVPLALVAILLAGLVNLLGIRITSTVNLMLAAMLLAALISFIAVGASQIRPTSYRPFFTGRATSFLAAIQIAITAYGAWTVIPATIEEVQNPARTAPRAILLSLGIVTLLYTTIIAVLHGIIPSNQFTNGGQAVTTPLGVAVTTLGYPWLRYVLATGATIAIFTTMLVGILSASRVLFALGENGTLPTVFTTTRKADEIPWISICVVTGFAGLLAIFPEYFFQLLVVAVLIGTGLPYGINLITYIGFRRLRTDVTSNFEVPWGYPVAIIAFIALGVAMIGLGVTEILWSSAALVLISGYYVVQSFLFKRYTYTESSK